MEGLVYIADCSEVLASSGRGTLVSTLPVEHLQAHLSCRMEVYLGPRNKLCMVLLDLSLIPSCHSYWTLRHRHAQSHFRILRLLGSLS